ncbi:MAG TPA: alanyl-tRNA editing protein [Nitrososphaerales archaeon]|nr:alanyl-tRNA editing protein [Nitrososphaerales archaeon]
MTRRLYWEDMYMREFEGLVESFEGNRVVLDQTAFNPRGGGLVSDTGRLNGMTVVEATKEGDNVFHLLEAPADLRVGDRVHGVLDWERRHRIMRMHTTAHILSSVVNGETGALITGNQIGPVESRVDFNLEHFDKDRMSVYIEKVNDAVKRGLEVRAYFMKREEAMAVPGLVKLANAAPPTVDLLRIVQIGDVDTQADGGVHVKNTGEIGTVIGLRTENKGKNNRRVYFTVK